MRLYNKICLRLMVGLLMSELQYADSSLTLAESVAVGGAVGAAEVAFPGQLFSYAMNKVINGQPFVWKDSYKGFAVNAAGQMPITALQMAVQSKGTQLLEQWQGSSLSGLQAALVSYSAGVAGALIDTPSNAVQLYLQEAANAGKNSWQAVKSLRLKALSGFGVNAFLKEGLFAVGYQVLAPKGREMLVNYVGDNLAATALGGAGAGVLTAVLTQPGVVLRNKIQSAALQGRHLTALKAIREICATQGCLGLLRGLKERGARIVIAVPLYAAYTTALQKMLVKPAQEPSYFESLQQYGRSNTKQIGLLSAGMLLGYLVYQNKDKILAYVQKNSKRLSGLEQSDVSAAN